MLKNNRVINILKKLSDKKVKRKIEEKFNIIIGTGKIINLNKNNELDKNLIELVNNIEIYIVYIDTELTYNNFKLYLKNCNNHLHNIVYEI